MMRARHRSAALFKPWSPWRAVMRSRDPLRTLTRRVRLRQIATWVLPANWLLLAASFLVMMIAQTDIPVIFVAAFGLTAWLLHQFGDEPHTRRRVRILADRRPVLRRRVLVVPPQRRDVRILRSRPSPIVLSLPPSRPRSRALPRRPAMITDESE
jgi:hypothetical protein